MVESERSPSQPPLPSRQDDRRITKVRIDPPFLDHLQRSSAVAARGSGNKAGYKVLTGQRAHQRLSSTTSTVSVPRSTWRRTRLGEVFRLEQIFRPVQADDGSLSGSGFGPHETPARLTAPYTAASPSSRPWPAGVVGRRLPDPL